MAADAFIEIDPCACNRPLERPEDKLPASFDIESYPKITERLLQHRGDIREICGQIGLAGHERFDLREDLGIYNTSVRGSCESNALSHMQKFSLYK
jgi:hypothetical protein